MALWILLVALIYALSWAWLFTRIGQHTANVQLQRQTAAYEKAM